jgi:hypothetical protein
MLRHDERFVIESTANHYRARWREGENPPDAYLEIAGKEFSVEISTLVQLVAGNSGDYVSRMSQDATALDLALALDRKLKGVFPGTRAAFLTLTAPIERRRKLEIALLGELTKLAQLPAPPTEPIDVSAHGNNLTIHMYDDWEAGRRRVAASVMSRRSSRNLLVNASEALHSRLKAKSAWSKAASGGWLALLNPFEMLVDADTYQTALEAISVDHNFSRIVIVSSNGSVDEIFNR